MTYQWKMYNEYTHIHPQILGSWHGLVPSLKKKYTFIIHYSIHFYSIFNLGLYWTKVFVATTSRNTPLIGKPEHKFHANHVCPLRKWPGPIESEKKEPFLKSNGLNTISTSLNMSHIILRYYKNIYNIIGKLCISSLCYITSFCFWLLH